MQHQAGGQGAGDGVALRRLAQASARLREPGPAPGVPTNFEGTRGPEPQIANRRRRAPAQPHPQPVEGQDHPSRGGQVALEALALPRLSLGGQGGDPQDPDPGLAPAHPPEDRTRIAGRDDQFLDEGGVRVRGQVLGRRGAGVPYG